MQIADTIETIHIVSIQEDAYYKVQISLVYEMLARNIKTIRLAGTYSLDEIEILIQVRRVEGSGIESRDSRPRTVSFAHDIRLVWDRVGNPDAEPATIQA